MHGKLRHRGSYKKQKTQQRNWLPIIVVVGFVLILGGLVTYVTGNNTAVASSEYHSDDVAHNQPFVAIHEMGEDPEILFIPRNEPQPKIQLPETSF